jgi:hypothetical protein
MLTTQLALRTLASLPIINSPGVGNLYQLAQQRPYPCRHCCPTLTLAVTQLHMTQLA